MKVSTAIPLALIRFYKIFLSPLFPSACRFQPTCSVYTYEAIEMHGVIKGSWLGVKRLARCGPWSKGGYDPVPDSHAAISTRQAEREAQSNLDTD